MFAILLHTFFFSLIASAAIDENSVSMHEYIRTGLDSDRVVSSRRSLVEHRTVKRNTSFLRNAQFRFSGKEANLDQKFSLRLSPFGFGEPGAAQRLATATEQVLKSEMSVEMAKELRRRYTNVLELSYKTQQRAIIERLNGVLLRKVKAVRAGLRSKRADITKIMRVDMELSRNLLALDALDTQIRNLEAEIEIQTRGKQLQIPTQLVQVAEIGKRVKQRKATSKESVHIQLANKKLEQDKADLEYAEAKENRILDFVDLGVDGDRSKKDFAVSVAINIPIFKENQQAVDSRRVDVIKRDGRLRAKIQTVGIDLYRSSQNIMLAVSEYQKYLNSELRRKFHRYKKIYAEVNGADTADLLSIQEQLLRSDMDLIDLKFKARQLYLEHLYLTGDLVAKPYMNYLSTKLETFL